MTNRLSIVVVLLAACHALAQQNPADAPQPVPAPAGAPLAATWDYAPGGKPAPIPVTGHPDPKNACTIKATFSIPDPAAIGGVRITAASGAGAFALTDADSVQRRYIGASPVLLNLKLTVNGKPTDASMFPSRLYNAVLIDPAQLTRGANTVTLSAILWATPNAKTPATSELKLETLPANLLVLDRGPTLGDIGPDYFTFTARGQIASNFSVTVKPLEPAGADATVALGSARLLRAKVPFPKGTKKFSYTLTASAGGASKSFGPYDVTVPVFGTGFRFIAAGNTYIYGHHPAELVDFFEKLSLAKPHLFVHGGVFQNVASHDGPWTDDFFRYSRNALARIPMIAVPGYPDTYSPAAFGAEFYFPTENGQWDYWTRSYGPVRLIGIEAMQMCEDNGRGLKWLEDTLKAATEDYVIVFNSQASHCSGQNAKYFSKEAVSYVTKNVAPMLAKYHATAMIGSYHYVYERSEPAAGEGVTTIMTSKAGGLGWPLRQDMREANKASKVAVGYKNHYCLFELTADCLQMQAVAYETGEILDKIAFKPRPH